MQTARWPVYVTDCSININGCRVVYVNTDMVRSGDNSKLPFVVQDRDQVEDLAMVKDKERIKTNKDVDLDVEAKVALYTIL